MVYAIVESGNKQYKIQKGSVIDVEKLDAEKDSIINIDSVLFASNGDKTFIGTPYIKGVTVKCKVADNIKGKKVIVFKYKNKTNYHRKTGHRQKYTRLIVEDISF